MDVRELMVSNWHGDCGIQRVRYFPIKENISNGVGVFLCFALRTIAVVRPNKPSSLRLKKDLGYASKRMVIFQQRTPDCTACVNIGKPSSSCFQPFMCQQLSCSLAKGAILLPWKLTYSRIPSFGHVWRWSSFSQGGICYLYNPGEVISLPGAMSIAWMCLGRLISGCAVGLLSTVVALYQSEVAPAHMRGGLTSLYLAGEWNFRVYMTRMFELPCLGGSNNAYVDFCLIVWVENIMSPVSNLSMMIDILWGATKNLMTLTISWDEGMLKVWNGWLNQQL